MLGPFPGVVLDFFSSSLSFASVLGIFYCLAPTYIYIYIDNFFFLSKAGSYIFFNILKFNDCLFLWLLGFLLCCCLEVRVSHPALPVFLTVLPDRPHHLPVCAGAVKLKKFPLYCL